jgi:hypothetical protein
MFCEFYISKSFADARVYQAADIWTVIITQDYILHCFAHLAVLVSTYTKAVTINITVFWEVPPYNLVITYQIF